MIIVTASDIVTGIATITIGDIATDTATVTTAAIIITTNSGFGFSHDRSLGLGDRFFV